MKSNLCKIRNTTLFVASLLALTSVRAAAQTKPDSSANAVQTAAVPARITQAIDETQLVQLKGNVHPLARPEFDQGLVPDTQPLSRMLLLLQRSPEQETSLRQLLDEQQSKASPNYHTWMAPEKFGKQFGPADADIQAVTDWLHAQGFQVGKVAAGRTAIEFSGTVGQVRNAFHTELHQFLVKGEARIANVADPQIPAALAPVVAGVVSLHNFPKTAQHKNHGVFTRSKDSSEVKPMLTTTSGCGTTGTSPCYALGPADFAKIYNIPPTLNGAGQSIAIVGQTNIHLSDVQAFRQFFGQTTNDPTIILNGPDPGVLDPTTVGGDEVEAIIDVQWSGAVAPGATIYLVVSESPITSVSSGVDLSALYIVDNNLAPVMSESYGQCEANLGTAGNAFFNTLWEQAAAEGITVILSAGDNGSAGCDNPFTQAAAANGVAVSGLASTPFNVALGGTDFDDATNPLTYWNSANTPGSQASAKSYIPELTWNDSCALAGLTSCTSPVVGDLIAGSGGPSLIYPKPVWQTGLGDTKRDIPDVSLFSSAGFRSNNFYLVCEADMLPPGTSSCSTAGGSTSFVAAGGTSVAAPAFAGVMALINQQFGRQGNANYVLYQLHKTASLVCTSNAAAVTATGCVFYDVINGNNSVACQGNSANCSNNTAGQFGVMTTTKGGATQAWNAGAGYDLATGLGSVNVGNLVQKWNSATFNASTATITAAPSGSIAHGTPQNFTVTVAHGTGGSGTPTGDVSLNVTPSGGTTQSIGPFTLNSSGVATFSTNLLPGGTPDSISAHYSGDSLFAPSDSATVSVTVNQESSLTTIGVWTFDPNTGAVISTTVHSVVYGTTSYIMRVDVTNSLSQQCSANVNATNPTFPPIRLVPCPTGNVTLTDNGTTMHDFIGTTPATASLNGQGFLEDQPIQLTGGTHSIVATYAGDGSYIGSMSAPPYMVSVSTAPTTTSVTSNPTTVATGVNVVLTAVIATTSSGAGPTGTVTFTSNGATLGTAPVVPTAAAGLQTLTPTPASGTAALTTTFGTTGAKTIIATYGGDTNYQVSPQSASITVTVTSAATFAVGGTAAMVTTAPAAAGTMATGTSTITVTPSGGFVGAVAITCGSLPGVTCIALTIPSGSTTGTLTINVLDPSSSMTAMVAQTRQNLWAASVPARHDGGKGWWTLSGGTGFAALLLLLLPGRKRYRAALGLGLVCVLSFALGCGGYGGPGGITPATTTTKVSVANTKVASGTSLAFTVAVTSSGTAAAGTAQVFDGTTSLGTAAVAGGTATINAALTTGTHSISARYLGDTYTMASQSGTLMVTATGNTTVTITGTSGTTTANGNVSLTIN